MSITVGPSASSSTNGLPPQSSISVTVGPASPGDVIVYHLSRRGINIPLSALVITASNTGGPITPPTTLQTRAQNFVDGGSTYEVDIFVGWIPTIPVTDSYTINVQTVSGTNEFILRAFVLSGVDSSIAPSGVTSASAVATNSLNTGNIPSGDFIFDAITVPLAATVITPVPLGPVQLYQTIELPSAPVTSGLRDAGYSRTTTGVQSYILTNANVYVTATIGFFALVICVAKDTSILMADGTNKPIQHVQRGDLVAGDLSGSVNRVARVVRTRMPGITPVSIVKISKDALGENQPHTNLTISSGHPILLGEHRYRAKCFFKTPGVKYYSRSKNTADKVLPSDDNSETYSLYNLQFEHDGYFVANGLIIDSVPVLSTKHPLPKQYFFNPELYNVKTEYPKPHLYKRL